MRGLLGMFLIKGACDVLRGWRSYAAIESEEGLWRSWHIHEYLNVLTCSSFVFRISCLQLNDPTKNIRPIIKSTPLRAETSQTEQYNSLPIYTLASGNGVHDLPPSHIKPDINSFYRAWHPHPRPSFQLSLKRLCASVLSLT